ncbi:hypothetical protein [uncultured Aquimarina sp.]|uniref:hypothetical protein n=1 Tax=uncultured Aquimarina sp. TaxID=575652 RepID=UPI00260D3232|nr:hypothetical protein [uncultured Aquimarina sp.]
MQLSLITIVSTQTQNNFTDSKRILLQNFTYDMSNIFKGTGYPYSRPLYWKGNDFLKFDGVVATTFGFAAIDEKYNNKKSKVGLLSPIFNGNALSAV